MDTHNPVLDQLNRLEAASRRVGYLKGWLHAMLLVMLICGVMLATGCATMVDEHKRVENWPQLTVRDNIVSAWAIQKRCYKYMSLPFKLIGGLAMACAEIDFAAGTCDIYRAHDATAEVLEHEHSHCAGGDHPGDSTLRRAWIAYQGGAHVR